MSAIKRSRQRQTVEAQAASPSYNPPASKRLKTTKNSHVPTSTGLDFLVDEDARKGRKLEAKLTNGVPNPKATRVDESHAVVAPDRHDIGSSPDHAIGISSDEESGEDSEEGEDDEEPNEPTENDAAKQITPNGGGSPNALAGADQDEEMQDLDTEQQEDAEHEELSFGEMLRARHPEPIDIHASFPDPMADRQALIPISGDRTLAAPSGTSLTTVLTQALKTNDKDLLESCFQTTDLPSIRSTIQRLQSQHVAALLKRLAERIHKRPGRTGSLLVWVQWSLVAHGGYLASQPEVVKRLKSLAQVIQERANGLQPLLHLKGKLDMLSAQLELRRSMQAASRAAHALSDEEDEEGVVYVEGQDDDWSDSDDEAAAIEDDVQTHRMIPEAAVSKRKGQTSTPRTDLSDSSGDESEDGLPNGVIQEGDDASSDEEDEGLFDVEAEEASDDEDDEEEASDDEAESDGEESEEESDPSGDESDASAVKAPLPKTLNRKR